ncbi:P-loop containing nucleoside triphosphate hydrolase protein [Lineolata rhizophorae]|uniref:Kinesin-like protein KIF22 n=1 Tax=Lineolata rhizophorae TaxID=578093 RepID=A0A6A6P0W5_9PEZI|nr:P-loop containing nucleoside triphosphate hydrolase protein [Lineolata rhizophorae]
MSVRVVARIRPLLKLECAKDTIVEGSPAGAERPGSPTLVRIPNPKNESESFSFQFHGVYDQEATQQEIFEKEISPTVKHLFGGFDVTIFAYGVTGTGKTHTMRGGKSLADRGVIPRLLSAIYRRSRKIEKDSGGETSVEVAMSYYEIYNDRVYDLFEAPEKRTAAGLPIRDNGGKTVVVGLSERTCWTLKEFEQLYDQANVNRSTSATKVRHLVLDRLNAHSSRSHAIVCIKVTQTSPTQTRTSTVSAIDLAGSEDNRRTDNNKDRLVESASINKSLFVLAQCVEAISKKQSRIPYRESKMTRILSLGQNNGLTVMILNLAPVRAFHLDTLSSLNFANRTKKIEVNEVENEPVFRAANGPGGAKPGPAHVSGANIQRQPLRPLAAATNSNALPTIHENARKADKPVKQFSVYSDTRKPGRGSTVSAAGGAGAAARFQPGGNKRSLANGSGPFARPAKAIRPNADTAARGIRSAATAMAAAEPALSKDQLEALIERLVEEKLASKSAPSSSDAKRSTADAGAAAHQQLQIPPDLQRRLEALEHRVDETEDRSRKEGLQYLLLARQHAARGEDGAALRMYGLARPFFPGNEKLAGKMRALEERIGGGDEDETLAPAPVSRKLARAKKTCDDDDDQDGDYEDAADDDYEDDDGFRFKHKSAPRKRTAAKASSKPKVAVFRDEYDAEDADGAAVALLQAPRTPRTQHLLRVINSRDVAAIRNLRGVGAKKAEAIVNALCEAHHEEELITDLAQLGGLKGVGSKTVENMRAGILV